MYRSHGVKKLRKTLIMPESRPPQQVRCRQITTDDLYAIASLLARGFPVRPRQDWQRALEVLRMHATPAGFPRYGYLLESGQRPVGAILMISKEFGTEARRLVRCNVSSWCVEPEFRSYAALLNARVLKHQPATYLNISAAPHTWRTIEVQGFTRYRQGVFVAVPLLSKTARGCKVRRVHAHDPEHGDLPHDEIRLTDEHIGYGCLALCCTTGEGVFPFLFRHRRIKRRLVPCLQLIYCRSLEALAQCAGALGRYLALRGLLLVLADADGPIAGVAGRYFPGHTPLYAKGADVPRPGDLSYTEAALFGY